MGSKGLISIEEKYRPRIPPNARPILTKVRQSQTHTEALEAFITV
jgi:hypothetical protein